MYISNDFNIEQTRLQKEFRLWRVLGHTPHTSRVWSLLRPGDAALEKLKKLWYRKEPRL